MNIKLEHHSELKDIEIIIKYPVKTNIVNRIVSLIKSVDVQIQCYSYSNEETALINASDIFYIESIDGKTIVSCEKEKYIVKCRLYQVFEKIKETGFIQISKYCIVNTNKLDKFIPLNNYRLDAVLSNNTHLCVSRKYISSIKQILRGS